MLEIENLSVILRHQKIIKNISVKTSPHSVYSILGANGAGKSTLLRAILNLVIIDSGSITVDGKNTSAMEAKLLARKIAYLPQSVSSQQPCTVSEFVALGNYPWDGFYSPYEVSQRIEHALEVCRVSEFRNRIVSTLSGGERQRVLMAQVMVQNTPVILLDEPAIYLDLKHQMLFEEILLTLKNHGKSIVYVTHDLQSAWRVSNQVALMKDGVMIRQGTPQEIITSASIADTFDVDEKKLQFWQKPIWNKEQIVSCPAHY